MKNIKERFASIENQLRIARACQAFKDTEAWKVIQSALTSEQAAYTKQLLADKECTVQSIARLQGVVAAITWFYNLMDQRSARLSDLEKQHKDLAKKIELLDKMPRPDVESTMIQLADLESFGGKP
jgi:hypothetical protein